MNQDFSDDFNLKDGTTLTLANRLTHYKFANDWQIDGACTANCRKRRDEPEDPEETDPICESVFRDSYFDACKEFVSADDAINICKLEYGLSPQAEVLNRIVENYVNECKAYLPDDSETICAFGSFVWYDDLALEPDDGAPFRRCSSDQTYSGCLKPSRDLRSCLMFRQNYPVDLSEGTEPGCKCNEGFFLEEDECVAASDCPTYPGVYVGFDTDGDGTGDGPDPFFDSGLVTIDESEFEE